MNDRIQPIRLCPTRVKSSFKQFYAFANENLGIDMLGFPHANGTAGFDLWKMRIRRQCDCSRAYCMLYFEVSKRNTERQV